MDIRHGAHGRNEQLPPIPAENLFDEFELVLSPKDWSLLNSELNPRSWTNFQGFNGEVKNRATLIAQVQQVTRQRLKAALIEMLEDKGVQFGPINDIGKAFADAQVQPRGLKMNQPL